MFKSCLLPKVHLTIILFSSLCTTTLMASEDGNSLIPVSSGTGHSFQRDLQDFLAKMQFKGQIVIQNAMDKPANIEVVHGAAQAGNRSRPVVLHIIEKPDPAAKSVFSLRADPKKSAGDRSLENPTIASIPTQGQASLWHLAPQKNVLRLNTQNACLNIKSLTTDAILLSVDLIQYPIFPRPLKDFNFIPPLYQGLNLLPDWVDQTNMAPYIGPHTLSDAQALTKSQKDFDGNLITLAVCMAKDEQIEDPLRIFQKRAELYARHGFNQWLNSPVALQTPRIPLLTHRFWLTNPQKPCELPDKYIEWARLSANVMPESEGWQHILWIPHRDVLPGTFKKISQTQIQIREIFTDATCTQLKDLSDFECRAEFETAFKTCKFGMASDIIRLAVVEQLGGSYDDTDYQDAQSSYLIHHWYNFFVGLEPMSNFLGNAKFGASPHHTVIKKALWLIKRNFDLERKPDYLKDERDAASTILKTGPGNMTIAFHLAAGEGDNRDIAFPPAVLYPSRIPDLYPQGPVQAYGAPMPPEALGAHYWDTSWDPKVKGATFGSKG